MALRTLIAFLLLLFALILLYRWVTPPITPLMLLRFPETGRIDRHSVPLTAISRELQYAVIASEDNRFCLHRGVDWNAVSDAVDEYETEGRLRGASTITMQVARNLFLWPGGGVFRKGIEVPLAYAIDALWPKRRIMEVYLNVIEWGNGIYGAEAAAEASFGTSAARLSRREAALMAAVLPNPRRWSPQHPTPYIAERAAAIAGRSAKLEGLYLCLR
ncbi:MAG TPA: monofunctional biosynthetic peptidoglycan transglycosylase [Alphaproteobacteria bacterium]|nr:monofunctional biosynthetic peptidoglycan transglycosylase [Alphaproteobacteria bacterium]